MTPEDYVSYPIAIALKKAGFDWKCDHYWYKVYTDSDKMEMRQASADDYNNDDWSVPHCSAPHIYHAQKWLREKRDCCVTVYAQPYNGLPYYTGYILFNGDEKEVLDQDGHWFDDYEQCLSETIAATLELIKEPKPTEYGM